MRVILKSKKNLYTLMRKLGYHPKKEDKIAKKQSFVRRLTASDYPRFHVYLESQNDKIIINLHLDQKKPIYKGTPAHAGEYDSEVVRQEAERIKNLEGPIV